MATTATARNIRTDLAWLHNNLAKRLANDTSDLRIAVEDTHSTLGALLDDNTDADRRMRTDLAWLHRNLGQRLATETADMRIATEDAYNMLGALLGY